MEVTGYMRSATSLRILVEVAADFGLTPEECLASTGIGYDRLIDPESKIPRSSELQAVDNVIAKIPKTACLGVSVGRRMHVNVFGIWGFAILSCPTVRDAVVIAKNYNRVSLLLADFDLAETGDRARLPLRVEMMSEEQQHYIIERFAAVNMNFFEAMIDKHHFEDFAFEVPDTDKGYLGAVSKKLGIRTIGGQDGYSLSYPRSLLDVRLPKSDPTTLRYCLQQCEALAKHSKEDNTWHQKVRRVILEDLHAVWSLGDVASELSLTERTLRRRLTEEGTSFRQLYSDVRLTLAYELLTKVGLNVDTVAWRVGYHETSSFARAFAKKYGLPPGQVRRIPGQNKSVA